MEKVQSVLKWVRDRSKTPPAALPVELLLEHLSWEQTLALASTVGWTDIVKYIGKQIINKFTLAIDADKIMAIHRALCCSIENQHQDISKYLLSLWCYNKAVSRNLAEKCKQSKILEFLDKE